MTTSKSTKSPAKPDQSKPGDQADQAELGDQAGSSEPTGDDSKREDDAKADSAEVQRDGTPEGYQRAFAAFGPAGIVIATAEDESSLMTEAAAAGHERPVIVPCLRPKPEREG